MVIIIYHNSASHMTESPLHPSFFVVIYWAHALWLTLWGGLGFNNGILTGLPELKSWRRPTRRKNYMYVQAHTCTLEHHYHAEHTVGCWTIMKCLREPARRHRALSMGWWGRASLRMGMQQTLEGKLAPSMLGRNPPPPFRGDRTSAHPPNKKTLCAVGAVSIGVSRSCS